MHSLQTRSLRCPYCGERIEIVVDCSIPHQEYVEDCNVCCRPITVQVLVRADDDVTIESRTEDD